MASSYLRRGMTGPATFSLYIRNLPPERGFLVARRARGASTLETFSFDEDELGYLGRSGSGERDIEGFRGLAVRRRGAQWWRGGKAARRTSRSWRSPRRSRPPNSSRPCFAQSGDAPHDARGGRGRALPAGRARQGPGVDFAFPAALTGREAAMALARASAIVGFAATRTWRRRVVPPAGRRHHGALLHRVVPVRDRGVPRAHSPRTTPTARRSWSTRTTR